MMDIGDNEMDVVKGSRVLADVQYPTDMQNLQILRTPQEKHIRIRRRSAKMMRLLLVGEGEAGAYTEE